MLYLRGLAFIAAGLLTGLAFVVLVVAACSATVGRVSEFAWEASGQLLAVGMVAGAIAGGVLAERTRRGPPRCPLAGERMVGWTGTGPGDAAMTFRQWPRWFGVAIVAAMLAAWPLTILTFGLVYDLQHQQEYAAGRSFDRIQTDMSRDQVAGLLGSPGEVVGFNSIAGHPEDTHLPGAPPGWTGVVWGDTIVCWRFGQAQILVGFVDGGANSKWFDMPSL